MRTWFVVLVVGLLAGCLEDSTRDPTRAVRVGGARAPTVSVPEIAVVSGVYESVELVGTGFATIVVSSQENVTLNVSVTHPDMERQSNSYRYNDTLTTTYGSESNHTFIFLFPEEDGPQSRNGYRFTWWGMSNYQDRPDSSDTRTTYPGVVMRPGEVFLLAVSTSVPGFTIHFAPGGHQGNRETQLALGNTSEYGVYVPAPRETATANQNGMRLERDRTWETGMLAFNATTLLVGVVWDIKVGDVNYQGTTMDHLSLGAQRGPEPAPTPDGGTGASVGTQNVRFLVVPPNGQAEMYRHMVENHIGTYDHGNAGIRLLTIPLN